MDKAGMVVRGKVICTPEVLLAIKNNHELGVKDEYAE